MPDAPTTPNPDPLNLAGALALVTRKLDKIATKARRLGLGNPPYDLADLPGVERGARVRLAMLLRHSHPDDIRAREEARAEADPVARFMAARTAPATGHHVSVRALWDAFRETRPVPDFDPVGRKAFRRRLEAMGYAVWAYELADGTARERMVRDTALLPAATAEAGEADGADAGDADVSADRRCRAEAEAQPPADRALDLVKRKLEHLTAGISDLMFEAGRAGIGVVFHYRDDPVFGRTMNGFMVERIEPKHATRSQGEGAR